MGMSAWLKYEKADCDYVATLKCLMCIEKLRSMRKYNPVFVVGSKNLRASYVATLKCLMCIEKLRGMRKYNPAFVVGSKNHNGFPVAKII